jgi:hypothetical protein
LLAFFFWDKALLAFLTALYHQQTFLFLAASCLFDRSCTHTLAVAGCWLDLMIEHFELHPPQLLLAAHDLHFASPTLAKIS